MKIKEPIKKILRTRKEKALDRKCSSIGIVADILKNKFITKEAKAVLLAVHIPSFRKENITNIEDIRASFLISQFIKKETTKCLSALSNDSFNQEDKEYYAKSILFLEKAYGGFA